MIGNSYGMNYDAILCRQVGGGAHLSKFKDEWEKFGFFQGWFFILFSIVGLVQIRKGKITNLKNGSTNDSKANHNCSNTHLGEKKLHHLSDTVLEHFHFVLTGVRGSL